MHNLQGSGNLPYSWLTLIFSQICTRDTQQQQLALKSHLPLSPFGMLLIFRLSFLVSCCNNVDIS